MDDEARLAIDTVAVHAGREDLTELGVHAPPLDLSTTYPLPDLQAGIESYTALAEGHDHAASPVYQRLHNPTVARFEVALAALERAEAAVAFGSGMAALNAVLASLPHDRRHVVAIRPLYGGTDHLLTAVLDADQVSWATPSTVGRHCRPDTGLVVIETPANPTLALVDIAEVAAQAGSVPVLVDNTFATPVLQRPLAHGATYVLHSATKYLGGHSDTLGGVIATSEERARRLRQTRALTGAILHPLSAYLLHRGLQTLPLRVRAAQATAGQLARRLASHPAVARVRYPGFDDCSAAIRAKQMDGPGAMVAFEVCGGAPAAAAVLSSLSLITHAVSLGSVDTLIQHPAGVTHQLVDPEAKAACGVTPNLLRLSVGLEDVEDLWADLRGGLERAAKAA